MEGDVLISNAAIGNDSEINSVDPGCDSSSGDNRVAEDVAEETTKSTINRTESTEENVPQEDENNDAKQAEDMPVDPECPVENAEIEGEKKADDGDSRPRPEAEPQADVELEPKADLEPEPEAELELEPEADLEPEPKADLEPEPKADLEPEPEAELELEPKADLEPEPKADLEPEPKADLEPEPKADLEPEPKADLEPEPKADLEPEPKADLEPEPEAELELEPDPKADLEPDPKADLEPDPKADLEPEPEAEPVPEPVVVETEEERRDRVREFYNTEFSRSDLEQHGSGRASYTIIRYDNYQRPSQYYNSQSNKKREELNEGNAKIAEYFGEDLNSDEEFDQLIKQFAEASPGDSTTPEGTGDTHGGAKQQTTGIDSKQRLTQQSSIPATIPEEKENEAAAESNVAKQKDKSKGDKKKKNFDIASTKVHIRHLPKNMRKEDFLEAIGPLPEYNYLHFTSGQFMSRVCSRKCTGFCHINFVHQEDADAFVSNYRLFIIQDDRGEETLGSVEFAINQRVPKTMFSGISPGPLYDMQNDPKFMDFKDNYENTCGGIIGVPVNPDGSVTADVMMNEIEEKHQQKNELQTTPLLSYIIAQAKNEKEKKFGSAHKKGIEKSRITAKKERKRDRRDRRDRKEKDRDKDKVKILRTSIEDKVDVKDNKQSDRKPKALRTEKSEKAESSGKSRSTDQISNKEAGNRSMGSAKADNVTKRGPGSGAKEKPETDKIKKDKKADSPPKKTDKKQDKRQSGGSSGASNSRPSKSEASAATPKSSEAGKKVEEPAKVTTSSEASKTVDASATPITADQDKSQPKKKTVKRIVKVKKVIKSKTDEGGNTVASVSEKKEVSNSKPSDDSQTKSTSKTVESTKTESSCKEGSSTGGSDSKRTRKSRPDMAIYRPGSLRSNKTGDVSKSSESVGVKKENIATSSSATSKDVGSAKDKSTQDASNQNCS